MFCHDEALNWLFMLSQTFVSFPALLLTPVPLALCVSLGFCLDDTFHIVSAHWVATLRSEEAEWGVWVDSSSVVSIAECLQRGECRRCSFRRCSFRPSMSTPWEGCVRGTRLQVKVEIGVCGWWLDIEEIGEYKHLIYCGRTSHHGWAKCTEDHCLLRAMIVSMTTITESRAQTWECFILFANQSCAHKCQPVPCRGV